MVLVVRREVFVALLSDVEWSRRLVAAESLADAERVVAEFTEAKGYAVMKVAA